MLRWTQTATVLLLLLVAFGISGLAIYESSAYQKCSTEAGSHGGAAQQEKGSPHAFMPLINGSLIKFRCIGRSIDENDAVVTAVATVVIAVFTTILGLFTMSLARSTRVAADSAKKSADMAERALVNIERAWIFGGPDAIEKQEDGRIRFNLVVKNHGKTPGFVKVVWANVSKDACDSPNVEYEGALKNQVDIIIGSNNSWVVPRDYEMNGDQYFYGYIRYTDIFADTQVSGFCVQYVAAQGRFEYAGHPAWNNHCTEKRH